MFSARIAIRLPSSFMDPPSGFARRLGKERADERPERSPAAFRARGACLVVLADRHGARDFLLAPLAEILRSEEHTSELQSQFHLVCRLLLEKKNILSII